MEQTGVLGFIKKRRLIFSVLALAAIIGAFFYSGPNSEYKRHAKFGESCQDIHEESGAQARCVTLYFGTTREVLDPLNKGKDGDFVPVNGFNNKFADRLYYGRAEVSLPYLVSEEYPEGRKRGVVEYAKDAPPAGKKQTETLVSLTTISKAGSKQEFFNDLRDAVGENENSVLLFIHGFNVDFDSAVVRTAQLAVDLTYDDTRDPNDEHYEFGQPVLFSWPNGGGPFTYLDDQNLAEKSAAYLKEFLDELTRESDADTINIIVHSMGNRVFVKALEKFVETYSSTIDRDIDFKIIQAAADVDKDLYDDVMNKISQSGFKADYTVYASRQDTALKTSKIVNFFTSLFQQSRGRLGDIIGDDIYVRDGVTTVDATGFATDLYGHGYFSNAGNIVADISCALEDAAPEERALAPRMTVSGKRYYEADGSKCGKCSLRRVARYTEDPEDYLIASAERIQSSSSHYMSQSSSASAQYKSCWDGSATPVTEECPPQLMEQSEAVLEPLKFTIYFDYKKANLTPEAMAVIREAAERALANDIDTITVTGYTDTVGPEAYNLGLSERRAMAVRAALISVGVPAELIDAEGAGERNQASPTRDEVREPLNRRVEVVVTFK